MTHELDWYDFLVEAEVTLFPKEAGGKTTGITSGYRPNHNFGSAENKDMRLGEITVDNNEWIQPGQTKMVTVHFTMPGDYIVDLKPGLVWRIQEASKHVGNGKIINVLSRIIRTSNI